MWKHLQKLQLLSMATVHPPSQEYSIQKRMRSSFAKQTNTQKSKRFVVGKRYYQSAMQLNVGLG